MSSNKRKVKKYRGSKTHGGGAMKKRRGAGSRGGRGKAGRGKRGDQKKPSIWKRAANERPYLGKYGFTSVHPDVQALNVSDVEKQLATLLADEVASESKGVVSLDLADIGVEKLLGGGQLSTKLSLKVKSASSSAIKKVEDAGGSVTLTEEATDSEE